MEEWSLVHSQLYDEGEERRGHKWKDQHEQWERIKKTTRRRRRRLNCPFIGWIGNCTLIANTDTHRHSSFAGRIQTQVIAVESFVHNTQGSVKSRNHWDSESTVNAREKQREWEEKKNTAHDTQVMRKESEEKTRQTHLKQQIISDSFTKVINLTEKKTTTTHSKECESLYASNAHFSLWPFAGDCEVRRNEKS